MLYFIPTHLKAARLEECGAEKILKKIEKSI